jgi:hypothetical protein
VEKKSAQPGGSQKGESASREGRQGDRAELGEAMNDLNNDVPKFVTQARASYMLGIPEGELRRISNETGLGHLERAGREEEVYFTYEELRRICMLAAEQLEAGR